MATRSPRRPGVDPSNRRDPDQLAAEVERLRARLEEAEQRNRDLLEGSLQGVMVHRDNRILFANQAFADIFGYPHPKAVLEMGAWQRCQAPAEIERMESYRAARMRGEAPPARYTFEGRRQDGKSVWVENVARLITWEGEQAILSSLLDITDRRRAEVELRRSEERFRIAFENAPMGVGIGFPDVGFVQVNEEYCKFLGWSREELLKHPNPTQVVKDVTHPEDFEKDLNQFHRMMRGEIDSYQMEKRFIRRDGELRWGQLAVSSAQEPDGPRRYVIGHLIDITERKRAEEALRESEERFRVAFESSPLGLALGTPETGWQQTNRAFQEFLGRAPGDPVFKADLVTQLHANSGPGDSAEHERLHRELVAGQRDSFQLEKRYRTMDGRSKWGSLHVACTRNPDGSIKWLISQRLDITAQKEAEQALRESEERFRVAFEHAPVALAVAHFNLPGIQANAAMCTFLGQSKEWFATAGDRLRILRDTTFPEDLGKELAAFERIRNGDGDSYSSERRYLRPSGEVRWGSGTVSVTRTTVERVRYIIAQITDITERKLAEQALRESEVRFRIAFENAPIGIALGLADHGWIQVNPAMEAFLGRDAKDLLGYNHPVKLIKTITHPDDVGQSLALLQDMADGKINSYAHEKRYLRPDGEVRWGYHSASCSRDADDKLHSPSAWSLMSPP